MKKLVSVLLLIVLFTLAIAPCAMATTTTLTMYKTSNGKDLLDKGRTQMSGFTSSSGKVTFKQSGGKFQVQHSGKTETTPYAVLKVTVEWKDLKTKKNVTKSGLMKGSSLTISGLPANVPFRVSLDYQGSLIEYNASWLTWTFAYSKPKWVTAPKITISY